MGTPKQNKIKSAGRVLASLMLILAQATYASIPNRQRSIPLDEIVVVKPINNFNHEFYATFMPTDVSPTRDEEAFAEQYTTKVEQRVLDRFFNGDFFKKSTVGKMAKKVEDVAQASVVIGSKNASSVQQKIGFQVRAAEGNAALTYEGYVKSDVKYQLASNSMVISISKSLSDSTMLSITNTSPAGRFEQAGSLMLTHSF